jgi:cation:H+ antiporter
VCCFAGSQANLLQILRNNPRHDGLLTLELDERHLPPAAQLEQLSQAVHAAGYQLGLQHFAGNFSQVSNITNLGLMFAAAALTSPLLLRLRLFAPQIVFLLVASGAVLFFGRDGAVERWEGGLLLLGFAGCLFVVFRRGSQESVDVQREFADVAQTSTALTQNSIRLAFAAILLYFGAVWVVQSAVALGPMLGLSPVTTGLTIVAIGMALPEAAMAAVAARQGQANVVLGQVLGACLFNVLFIVGGMATIRPLPMPASLLAFGVPTAMAFALALYAFLGRDSRIGRREGGLLLALLALWLGFEAFQAWR